MKLTKDTDNTLGLGATDRKQSAVLYHIYPENVSF